MKNKLKCSCGRKVNSLRVENGKLVCDYCSHKTLSGQWERNNASDRQYYAKDILQPNDPNFKKVYGNNKAKKSI